MSRLSTATLGGKLYLYNSCMIADKGGVIVAKKKQRYTRKKNRAYHAPKTSLDKHHLCFIGRRWASGWLASFRQYWYCTIYIPRDTLHRYIHENIATIPAPRPESAKDALRQLQYLEKYNAIHDEDPIEKRLELIACLFDCTEQRTADAFRRQKEIVQEFYKCPS